MVSVDVARLLQAPTRVQSISLNPQLTEHESLHSLDDAGYLRNDMHHSYQHI